MKPEVLIVHSSLTIRMDLRSVLTTAGFAVTACGTLKLAQKMLRDKAYSLLVLDAILHDGDGFDLIDQIRSSSDFMHLPIMLLTDDTNVQLRSRRTTGQADEYVSKPYDRDQLAAHALRLVARKRSERAAHGGTEGGAGSLAGKRLLVVDDSPTYLETLALVLRRSGCHVVLAQSGEEALSILSAESFDCVILDLLMPGMGGMATAERIKRSPVLEGLPVIMLTGLDDFQVRSEAGAIGVDDVLLKSPELPLLTARLRRLFHTRSDRESRPPSSHAAISGVRPIPALRRVESASASASANAGEESRSLHGTSSLLTKVIAASGLSNTLGPSTIFRACKGAGVNPMSMSPADLDRALPAIQKTIRFLLSEEEFRRSVAALSLLTQSTAA